MVLSLFNPDNSAVLKMITIYNKEAGTVEEVLLEELQVFKVIIPSVDFLSLY